MRQKALTFLLEHGLFIVGMAVFIYAIGLAGRSDYQTLTALYGY